MTRLGTRPAGDAQLGRLVWLVLALAQGLVPSCQPGVSLAPVMPDPWHGLLLPPWGPVPQPQHGAGQPGKQWFLPAGDAVYSITVVAGTRCPRYQSVLHCPQSPRPGQEQASHTQPSSGAQGSLVIFHSGFLPRSGQALPALSSTLQSVFIHPRWRPVCPGTGSDVPFASLQLCPTVTCHWGILFCFSVSRSGSSFPFQQVSSHPSRCPRAWAKGCGSSLEVWPMPLGS